MTQSQRVRWWNLNKAAAKALVTTMTGSKYRLGQPIAPKKTEEHNGMVAAASTKKKQRVDEERAAQKKYNLNGKNIGPYLLSGKAERSTSGKSQSGQPIV